MFCYLALLAHSNSPSDMTLKQLSILIVKTIGIYLLLQSFVQITSNFSAVLISVQDPELDLLDNDEGIRILMMYLVQIGAAAIIILLAPTMVNWFGLSNQNEGNQKIDFGSMTGYHALQGALLIAATLISVEALSELLREIAQPTATDMSRGFERRISWPTLYTAGGKIFLGILIMTNGKRISHWLHKETSNESNNH